MACRVMEKASDPCGEGARAKYRDPNYCIHVGNEFLITLANGTCENSERILSLVSHPLPDTPAQQEYSARLRHPRPGALINQVNPKLRQLSSPYSYLCPPDAARVPVFRLTAFPQKHSRTQTSSSDSGYYLGPSSPTRAVLRSRIPCQTSSTASSTKQLQTPKATKGYGAVGEGAGRQS
jgi:hypothetical protein